MNVKLYKNNSENNTIGKNLLLKDTLSCVAKNSTSKMNPVIAITYKQTDFIDINYVYIEEWNRYYFITDIDAETGGRIILRLKVDVLESFKNDIKDLIGVIDRQSSFDNANMYINDGSMVSECKTWNSIYTYPNGFNEEGQYILITAGGSGVRV